MIHRLFLAFILLAAVWQPGTREARAESEADRLSLARQVLTAGKAAEGMKASFPLILNQVKEVIISLAPQARKDIDELFARSQLKFEDSADDFIGIVAQVYAREFTREDLEGLLSFYQSAAGRKFIDKQPELQKALFTAGSTWGQRVAEEALAEMKSELRKRGHKI